MDKETLNILINTKSSKRLIQDHFPDEFHVQFNWSTNTVSYAFITSTFSKEDFLNDTLLLLFLSYVKEYATSLPDDSFVYELSEYYELLPSFNDDYLHSISEVEILFVDEECREYEYQLPEFNSLFKTHDEGKAELVKLLKEKFDAYDELEERCRNKGLL